MGIGDWAQSPIPNPQSPIPNPHFDLYLNYLHINNYLNNLKKLLFIIYNIFILLKNNYILTNVHN